MDQYWQDALANLKDASEHFLAAHQSLVKGIDAALHAKAEHDDVKETVTRLEALVMEQGTEMRALRADVQALRKELGR